MKNKRTVQSTYCNLWVFICLVLVYTAAISAKANVITVTNTNDSGPGSLRQALADTNDGDTIDFAVTGTIGLTSGELLVDKSVTISGPGADTLAISEKVGFHFRVFNIRPGTNVSISQLKIMYGDVRTSGNGGGILNDHAVLALISCTLDSNEAQNGGAIYNDGRNGSAVLTISNSRVTYNVSTNVVRAQGGGIYNDAANGSAVLTIVNSTISNNSAMGTDLLHNEVGFAGGIYNSGGTLTIMNSTVAENHAGGGFKAVPGWGGGIYSDGTLTISNSTLDHNTAATNGPASGAGGGIYNGGTLMTAESTLSHNSATYGGGICSIGGSISIGNTILNRGDASGDNIYNAGGTITSEGYNLSSDEGSGYLTGPGDQINTDPLLGPLQNNGGATSTHALLPGSPAIDAGDPNFTPPPDYDQRGPCFVRVSHGRIDVGSVERQRRPPPCVRSRPTPAPRP